MGIRLLKQWPGFGLGLLGGALLTVVVRPSGESSNQGDGPVVAKRPVPLARGEATPSLRTGSATLAKLQEDPDQKSRIPEMKDAELQASMSAMLNEADPFKGFSYKEKSLFKDILDELAKRDPDGALDWVDNQLSGALRAYSYEELLGKRFSDDKPGETIDFFESRGFTREEVSKYAGKLMTSAENLGSEDAIKLLQKNFDTGSSSSGSKADFAEGFDYAGFAKEAIRLRSDAKNKGMIFSRFPTNLFTDWVKEDPHEAMEFYNQHYLGENATKLSFNGIEELAEGYFETASRDATEAWTSEILGNLEIPLYERRELVGFLLDPESNHGELLAAVGSAIADREQAVDFSGMVLERALSKSLRSYSDALVIFPDGESRIAKLELLAGKGGYTSRKLGENSVTLYEELGELGHSAADIQRIATALEKGE